MNELKEHFIVNITDKAIAVKSSHYSNLTTIVKTRRELSKLMELLAGKQYKINKIEAIENVIKYRELTKMLIEEEKPKDLNYGK